MKVNKTQAVLLILSILLEKGSFTKEEIKEEIEITDLKFKRYMQELRAFIYNFNLPYEINYIRREDIYILKK